MLEAKIPNFLIDMLQEQYGEGIIKSIIDGYTKKRKVTIRINTLKTTQEEVQTKLDVEKITYENVTFYKDALIIKNVDEKRLQELDMYKNGEIYLQSLSSMLPPIILEPKPNMDILDMCAAPGGKTTELATLSNNKAHITACEMNHIRMERLKYNIEKQGATCVYVMEQDARFINDFFSFDSILLDAPCSGSGTLNINDKNLEKNFTKKLIQKSTASQIALLKKALKILKPGREMVYSTCSILACENEDVVNEVLKREKVEVIPINSESIKDLPILPTKINGTLCICPNELYEGFFVVKLKKICI